MHVLFNYLREENKYKVGLLLCDWWDYYNRTFTNKNATEGHSLIIVDLTTP